MWIFFRYLCFWIWPFALFACVSSLSKKNLPSVFLPLYHFLHEGHLFLLASNFLLQNVNIGQITLSGPDSQQPTLLNPAVKAVKEIRFCSPAFIQLSAPLWPQGFLASACPPFISFQGHQWIHVYDKDGSPCFQLLRHSNTRPPLACTPQNHVNAIHLSSLITASQIIRSFWITFPLSTHELLIFFLPKYGGHMLSPWRRCFWGASCQTSQCLASLRHLNFLQKCQ